MTQPIFKGVQQSEIIERRKLHRDTRTLWQQTVDGLKSRTVTMLMMAMCVMFPWFMPEAIHVSTSIGLFIYLWRGSYTSRDGLPFRMPADSGLIDYANPKPGRTGFYKADGAFMLGNAFGASRSELWLGIRDMLTHMLVFGTTGSGKTEFLVSMSFNALAMGSGMFYVDPKAAPKLQDQIAVMCRLCGRDDDFRTINFLPSNNKNKTPLRTTNMINPFHFGPSEMLSELLISLLPPSEGGNAIFAQKGMSLMRALMRLLVEMRDRGEILLSVEVIRHYMTLQRCMELCERTDLSTANVASLRAFMESNGWQQGKPLDKQPRNLPEQFSYAASYFNQPLSALTDTYGHIYLTTMGEVDMRDVIMNRRILVVLLPSLAVSPEELKNLGKISLSSIRIAISVGLGDGKEGTFGDTLYALPTDAPAPFLSITDEYAAIPTPGYVEVLTQGRGLGIAAIVASQDYAGITKADKEGAEQLLENSRCKAFLKMTAAGQTWDLVMKLAGQVSVMESNGSAIKPELGLMSVDYLDQLSAGAKDRNQIELKDLQNQIEGEGHFFFGDKMIRGSSFFANPPLPKDGQIRIPQLLLVNPPNAKDVEIRYGQTARLLDEYLRRHEMISGMSVQEAEQVCMEESDALMPSMMKTLREVFDNPAIGVTETTIAAFMHFAASMDNQKAELDQVISDDPSDLNDFFSADKGGVIVSENTFDDAPFNEPVVDDSFSEASVKKDFAEAGTLIGLSEEVSKKSAELVTQKIELDYPQMPTLEKNPDKQDKLGMALESLLAKRTKAKSKP